MNYSDPTKKTIGKDIQILIYRTYAIEQKETGPNFRIFLGELRKSYINRSPVVLRGIDGVLVREGEFSSDQFLGFSVNFD